MQSPSQLMRLLGARTHPTVWASLPAQIELYLKLHSKPYQHSRAEACFEAKYCCMTIRVHGARIYV